MDRKEAFAMLQSAAPEIHTTTVEKGFWDKKEDRNPKEMVMLIISEIGEALEAHRKNRRFPMQIAGRDLWTKEQATKALMDTNSFTFPEAFENLCKDSLEDEIADTIIRVLDYIHGWNQFGKNIDWKSSPFVFEGSKNFAEDLCDITIRIIKARATEDYSSRLFSSDDNWAYVLKNLIALCDWWNIDILLHVQWKMRYNQTRERLHGKEY